MDNFSISAISPIDGRYSGSTKDLSQYFSEYALIRYRLLVEVEYLIALCDIPLPQLSDFGSENFNGLRDIYKDFTPDDAAAVKKIESVTNHDVKAVEYFLKEEMKKRGLERYSEFVHFGLTSQDVNNTALPLSMKEAWTDVMLPSLNAVFSDLKEKAFDWRSVPMLARTHGQPASPTTLGKEIYVFVDRIENQLEQMKAVPFSAKFGGATGNFNAHHVAYPEIDWISFGKDFVESVLGLTRSRVTTQIEHYDNLAAFCDNLKRINNILIDLNRDIWSYISMNYFRQRIKEGEVGSSTMPHKVNPIDFENAEGNLGVANAVLEHLAAKLPISRLQRDLTDSTVTRNIGVPLAHTLIALKSLKRGLSKIILNEERLKQDLENNWAVISEAIQTILRREDYPEPYEALKRLTRRHKEIDRKGILEFIDELEVSEEVKEELRAVSPENYTGLISF